MPIDKLTDPKIRQAKVAHKAYKLFDSGGRDKRHGLR
jgi:hypothetical protein